MNRKGANNPKGKAGSGGKATGHVHIFHASLDGVVKFVASESGHIEKDPSKGVSHPRFGLSETSDEGFVALTRRPGHWREIAKAIPTMTRTEVFSGDGQTKVMVTAAAIGFGMVAQVPVVLGHRTLSTPLGARENEDPIKDV